MCMVYQMDAAHNMSVRSVADPEQKLVSLCLLSRSYCIGFLKSAAKIQIKNEIFLRSCEKVQNLTQEELRTRRPNRTYELTLVEGYGRGREW